jgi:uncharacterized membrane protein required for colicin V production
MSDPSLRQEIERVAETLNKAEQNQKRVDPLLKPGSAPAFVRLFVTRTAIIVWAVFILGLGLFVIFGGANATQEKIANLIDLLKVGILPIVTFAIGHYFGSKSE